MAFKSNNEILLSSISDQNNVPKMTFTENDTTVNGTMNVNSTLTATTLKTNAFSNTSSTGITWDNPIINIDGKKYIIETRRYEVPEQINGLRFWWDLNESRCWDGTSAWSEDMTTRRKVWLSSNQSHNYYNESRTAGCGVPANNRTNNFKVMRTDDTGQQEGRILEQRPEWGHGYSDHTWIAWVWANYTGGNWNCIITQQENVAGSHYVIYRLDAANWNYYEQQTNGWSLAHSSGGTYFTNKAKWHMLCKRVQQSGVSTGYNLRQYAYSEANPAGTYVESSSRLSTVNVNGTIQGYQMSMTLGGNSWNTTENLGNDGEGYLGPVLCYDRALEESEMKRIYDYYKPKIIGG